MKLEEMMAQRAQDEKTLEEIRIEQSLSDQRKIVETLVVWGISNEDGWVVCPVEGGAGGVMVSHISLPNTLEIVKEHGGRGAYYACKPAGTERTRHSKINRAVAAFLDGCNRQWYGLPTSARLLSAKAGETRKDDQEVWEFRWANGLRGEMRIARSGVLMTLVGAADVDRGGKVTAVHG